MRRAVVDNRPPVDIPPTRTGGRGPDRALKAVRGADRALKASAYALKASAGPSVAGAAQANPAAPVAPAVCAGVCGCIGISVSPGK